MSQTYKIEKFAKVAARLLQTDLDNDDPLWEELQLYQIPLTEYFEKIGLALLVDKEDGFAFLKQEELDENGSTIGLVRRTPLGFEVSVICILLRELLEEHDRSDAIAKNYFIRHRQLKEHVELFFKEKANRVKFLKNIDFYINKLVEIGFLKIKEDADTVDNRLYQVKRILKAKISFAQLEEFKQRLENYVESF
jgi:hypothetical protein